MSLFCNRRLRDDDDRGMRREHEVTVTVAMMAHDPAWEGQVTASERREIAGRLVDTRRAVREGRLTDEVPS
jgi:hypothetical protein